MHTSELSAYLFQLAFAGAVDVLELFGGERGVGKLCARRRFKGGANFDLVIGLDFAKEEHQRAVIEHIEAPQFVVVILGPPRTSFGH